MLNETIQSALTESELLTDVLLHDKLVQESKPISTARKAIAEAQDVLNRLYKEGFQITPLVQARAWVIDRILTSLWQRTFSSDEPLSLIAVGGYGRGELHPWSDIDLLVLVEKEISTELGEKITPFITLLWDLKLDIGHSVRTMDECIAAAEEDITIETNLLETRCIAGPKELEQKLIRRIYSDEIYTDRAYFVAKREEQNQRHQKYSDTEYNLEPNIKSSPGTLRDIQTIGWITKRHFGVSSTQELIRSNFLTREEFETLNQGEKFLWELRYGLQMLAGRNENRLLFDYQRKLAELLGYEDNEESLGVEIMMHHYYRVVMEISELTELILQHFDEAILRADQPEEVLPLNKRFQLRNRYIEVTHDKVFNWAPYAMIELFLLIAQNPQIKGIRASTIRLLRFHFRDINDDFRNDLANTSLFMELLKTPHALDKTLNDMKRYHILENYLPEFGLIIGQMQHDLFHSYTVDAHTLRVIRNMVELRSSKKLNDFPLACRLIRRIPKSEILYISGLYHDIAKGRGGNHSTLGAVDAERFCQRHHLSQRDTHLISWLVENHLIMSMTAQRKDITDPDVIKEFARTIPSIVHLNYLYLLTVSDIAATNPTLWNSWRASLLQQLYLETLRALRKDSDVPLDRNAWIEATQQEATEILLQKGYTQAHIDAAWSHLDEDYFLQDSTTEIAWQTAAIIDYKNNPNQDSKQPLVLIRDGSGRHGADCTQIVIYQQSRNDLFAATTAVLEQLNLNIVDARINSTQGASTLSSFIVLEPGEHSISKSPERKTEVYQRIVEELDDPNDFPDIIHRRTPRQLKHFSFPTEVTFSNDMNHQRTLMEVITPDRPGLLAKIGRALTEKGVYIVNARIATLGERVEDVFVVSDHNGNPLSDPELCSSLRRDICHMLDNHPADQR